MPVATNQSTAAKLSWERASRVFMQFEQKLGEKHLTVPQIRAYFAQAVEQLVERIDTTKRFKDQQLRQLRESIQKFVAANNIDRRGTPSKAPSAASNGDGTHEHRPRIIGRRRGIKRDAQIEAVPVDPTVKAGANPHANVTELKEFADAHGGLPAVRDALVTLEQVCS